jgi:hypothetical protein
MTHAIVISSTAILELWVLRRLRFGWFVVGIVLLGTLVDLDYLAYTAVYERNYDAPSHLLYIDAIAEHLRMPTEILCTACGHPPLYYALAALWSKVVLAGGFIPRELGLQWLSLLLFFGFVVFSLLLLRTTLERPATMRLAAALVVFWPSSIIHSVRVHNDALASTLMVASMYFIAQWDRRGSHRDFYAAVATAALALLTKSTGYTVAAALLAVAALRLRSRSVLCRQDDPPQQPTGINREGIEQLAAAALVLFAAALLAVAFREPLSPVALCQKVLGHACDIPPEFFVGNKPINYLYFDLPGFVSETIFPTSPPGQDFFLNGLAKSCLFGMMPLGRDFQGALYGALAVVIRLILLAMAAVCLVVLPFVRRVTWQRYRSLALVAASMLGLLVAFRILVPTPFHEDFRHIFPVLVPLCLLYAKVVEHLGRWSSVLHKAGIGLGLLMIASSVAFFVRLP